MKHIPAIATPPAFGTLPYSMTNDYLFRAVLQKNNNVLKGLICALLHLKPHEVFSVSITNPIELGKAIDNKTFILDVKVLLNNHTRINLEMQVLNEGNWPERSLSYLCRSFDTLLKSQDYSQVQPAIHIGFLNFTLFPEYPEFFANYMLMNVKNYSIYSDKFRLSVVDLTQIHLATDEDKDYLIDYWASLFNATTWEDIHMIAQKSNCLKEASETLYQLIQDENIRLQCQARDDYYRRERKLEKVETMEAAILELTSINEELISTNKELTFSNLEKDNLIEKLKAEIEQLRNGSR